ncbi:MAG: hypothetical protein JW808_04350 [Victivallales bacterium]|nr:hypothetical protein [Victivallales bacterium]
MDGGIVEACRVRCVRTNEEIDSCKIPVGVQYALKVEANVGIVCQMGRMDVTQPNLAYYTTMGYGG